MRRVGDGTMKAAKNTSSTVMMPCKINVGSYMFCKLIVPYALSVALFGEVGSRSFKFHENEVVHRTSSSLYFHILSF